MFDIGGLEFIVIAIVVLIFAGPKQLPEMMRKLGRIAAELRSASRDLRTQIEKETGGLETPAEIGRQIRRDITEDLLDPYAEIVAAEKAVRKEGAEVSAKLTSAIEPSDEPHTEPKPGSGETL
ncbi:MAG: twin-arginine translocase TatA/TatE family subunit [Myxococcota bacterium]|nr:twin-arginine translocase TatA/TatE family subunit [Myxococcota bacterium]